MKRNLIASLLFACAVILAVASCGRPHSSETTTDTTKEGPSSPVEIKEEATKKGPSPPVEIKDPIISMMMASSIDEKGKLVNPRFSFPQTEKQITAIVQLGNIKSSQLTVTWYKTSDDGDEKLFEHQIQVKSRDRAFSVAKNPGRFMSAGTYKVVATLDGQTKEMEFDITPPKAAPKPKKASDNRDGRHFEGQTEFKDGRAVSAETNSDELLQPISYEPVPDQSEVRKVAGNESPQSGPAQSSGSTAAPGQPPVAGFGGITYQTNESDFSTNIGANNVLGLLAPPTALDSDRVTIRCWAWTKGQNDNDNGAVSIYETVHNKRVIAFSYAHFENSVVTTVDPCWVDGSDLPGTKIPLTAVMRQGQPSLMGPDAGGVQVGEVSTVITLGDDTSPPRVHVVSAPARHSRVKPGDKINLKVDATELKTGGSWQTGVYMIQVYALPGGQVGKPWVNSASPLSQKCTQKTWYQEYEATYTVPNNPPPIIELCAEAEDYVGNPSQNCGEFVTGDVWKGKLRSVSTQLGQWTDGGKRTGQCSNETWDGEFRVVVGGNGEVQGKGSGHLVAPPNCSGNLYFTGCPGEQATQVDFEVYGTFDGRQFQLAFSQTGINGRACGLSNYTIWLDPRHVAKDRSPSGFTVPVIAPGDAEGQVSNSVTLGGVTGNGQHTITMLCSDCK